MTRALTKEDLLRSVKDPEEAYITSLDGTVMLAPLTDGQWSQVEKIQMSGIKASGESGPDTEPEMTFDVAEVAANQHEAAVLAAWYSLNTANPQDKWSQAELKGLAPGIVDEIADHVYRITGVDQKEGLAQRVATFRKE
jgi:hypothetical protein